MMRTMADLGLPRQPGKVVAVHINYADRATERGRRPEVPSYFLKAPSSLTGPGSVERPAGAERLGFEGEIALVIGERAHRVEPDRAWGHVGWVTAANDLGLPELRYADAGSNLRSKSGDGFTPLGPRLLPAAGLDPDRLRVRTWVNGELRQSAGTDSLLFGFAELIADLSRLSTLDPGDVILTGTPAGAALAVPGDIVEVEVDSTDPATPVSTGRLRTQVVDGPPLAAYGAQPRVDDTARPVIGDETLALLRGVGVATLSAQLRNRGLAQVHVDGVHPVRPGSRFAGPARTLRYLPLREDLIAEHGTGFTAQKQAVESLRPGEVLVMEARGDRTAGTIGDLLTLRAQLRGAAGIVTDGCARDVAAVAGLDLPVFTGGAHPAVLGRRHVPWETDVAIGCGGALVRPGDVVVGDDDGVVVIPPELVTEVAAAAAEQERQERFIAEQLRAGAEITDLYPLGERWRAAYREWSE